MAKQKTWAQLTRRRRRDFRAFLRDWAEDAEVEGQHEWAEELRAALRELREPKK